MVQVSGSWIRAHRGLAARPRARGWGVRQAEQPSKGAWIGDPLGELRTPPLTASMPMADFSGLFTLVAFIESGTPFVLLESLEPDAVLDAIERHHGTWFLATPQTAAVLLRCQRVRPYRKNSCTRGRRKLDPLYPYVKNWSADVLASHFLAGAQFRPDPSLSHPIIARARQSPLHDAADRRSVDPNRDSAS